ncbi:rho-type GTPase activating protein Rga2 [Schizosaccharomyces cryophilus OY26]|uniref:Rho-type GTPase activating protein Rga2 n=1 Tax=Schizosaccharomyces cryophilus (strain OY26 / ATCC MYA-4695 / CBS 11777 / NBRC 106824 / NRRL Y48691) TaxID=653667 RepID=S9W0V3_SCHCR|nr:rho-type GTPase activating protein Rga2 [Schizosaccharomyces cryophilus OY26]EPY52059.1 rho-type GTPase activating protein Rga2 [Schizosaccharomyces cryophilus OY26]
MKGSNSFENTFKLGRNMGSQDELQISDGNATPGVEQEKLFDLVNNQRNTIYDLRRDLEQALSENGVLRSRLSKLENLETSLSEYHSSAEIPSPNKANLFARLASKDQRDGLSPSFVGSASKDDRSSFSSLTHGGSSLEERSQNIYKDMPQLLLNTKRLPVNAISGPYDPRSSLSSPVSHERYSALRNEAAKTRWFMKEDLDCTESLSPTSTNFKFSSVQDPSVVSNSKSNSDFAKQFLENFSAPNDSVALKKGGINSTLDESPMKNTIASPAAVTDLDTNDNATSKSGFPFNKNFNSNSLSPTPSLAYPEPLPKAINLSVVNSPETIASEPLSMLKVPDSDICLTRRLSDSNRTWTIIDPHSPTEQSQQQSSEAQSKESKKSSTKSFLSSFSSLTAFARPKQENRTKSDSIASNPQLTSSNNSETLYNSKLSFRLDEALVRYLKFDLMKTTLSSSSAEFDNIILHFVVGVTAVPPLASQWKDEVWSYSRSIGQCRAFDSSFILDVGAPPFPTLDWFANDSSYIQNELLRRSVDTYFRYIFQADLTLEQKVKLIQFLSKDTLREYLNDVFFLPPDHAQKEGVLLRYIKNIGLVSRYFYLKDRVLYYAENRNAPVLGTIQLQEAQVHRYSANLPVFTIIDPPHQFLTGENYQSAFVIQEKQTEQKNGTDTIHVLLAKDMEDQQSWLRSILYQIPPVSTSSTPVDFQIQASDFPGSRRNQTKKQNEKLSQVDFLPGVSQWSLDDDSLPQSHYVDDSAFEVMGDKENINNRPDSNVDLLPAGHSDTAELSTDERESELSFASTSGNSYLETDPRVTKVVPSFNKEQLPKKDKNASVEEDFLNHFKRINISGNKIPQMHDQSSNANTLEENRKEYSFETLDKANGSEPVSLPAPNAHPITKQASVFGLPLVDAVEQASQFNESGLPIVIYRCLEYLEAMRAEKEEGIYRLSGSSSAIKSLKEQFNKGIDYDLLSSDEMFDIHAVAGLLKLYLRELPTNLLDNSLQKIIELMPGIAHTQSSMDELCRVLGELPVENFVLLDSLLHHLRRIIAFEKYNKMNARNIGIVFSPTLNIPSEVFNMLIENYELIFTDYIRQTNANLVD